MGIYSSKISRRLLLGAASLPFGFAAKAAETKVRPDSSAIFGAFLSNLPRTFPRDRYLVVYPQTVALSDLVPAWTSPADVQKLLPELSNAAASDLLEMGNKVSNVSVQPSHLTDPLLRHAFPTKEELHAVLGIQPREHAWQRFSRRFPRAVCLVQFTGFGFDPESEEAVLVVRELSDATDGAVVYVLERGSEGWQRKQWRGLWMEIHNWHPAR